MSSTAGSFLGRSANSNSNMRGLVQFIADLRNARARELEEKRINKELANIRQKFKDGNLSGYHKKKYVCKLLYIYILGWNVDFGHLEAVNLISASKFSEKQIGYLAMTLFLHEKHELLHLVVNSIRKDLLDTNELFNCLALHAIANVGDIGVALSVTSLVMTLAQDNLDHYKGAYAKAAGRLKRILVDGEYTQDYLYYKVPCPWLQVKLLRLLQYFPHPDTHVRNMIRDALQKVLDTAMEPTKNVQQNNAQNAVLFEAINLIIHLDTEETLMMQISTRLGKFIQSRETNVRYLGLEAMTHLAARAEDLDPIKAHQEIILGSLKDRDISVRRKGLDLLYSMCDFSNARVIVGELLQYLQNADFAIREEMVLKIAILTEKYATDVQWYVDISLRLIAMAGDHVSDEVWQRVIQIVTNNEELQVYAAQHSLQYVKQDHCHETLVKIGCYILGEFGHLIADQPRHAIDAELQQRACEYLALVHMPTDDLLRTVCDEMPPFPKRQSALLSRLHEKHANTSDKRTWIVGGKSANSDAAEVGMVKNPGLKRTFSSGVALNTNGGVANGGGAHGNSGNVNGNGNGQGSGGASDLAGLDMLNIGSAEPKMLKAPNLASAAHLSPGWEPGYNKLLVRSDGVLFEDGQIQIGVRSEYRGEMACLILYFRNRTPTYMGSFTTTLDLDEAEKTKLTWDVKGLPDSNISQGAQSQQVIMFEAKTVFEKSPTIRISYLAGALQALTLKLPVAIHKFMDPADLTAEDFFKRWKQIGGAPREAQRIFGLASSKDGERELTEGFLRAVIEGFRWKVLDGVDPNAKNLVGASVLHTSQGGKFGCLMRLEPNYGTKMVRLTIRATDDAVPSILLKLMEARIAAGFSTKAEARGPQMPTRSEISDAFKNVMVA
ncbi:unnamed protein product [Parascedosporium putredinis]|uniref:AP-2 complex subunit alpha n=1 Tax=Parascedosporium putredinis TaxID=1442378 RepID=A0A9P1M6P2_9PEZI|nr:unnamed protein product [Parascedosporium putredinis]CAI7988795.1 unnamed protein product [Parascedosporium putredinis]